MLKQTFGTNNFLFPFEPKVKENVIRKFRSTDPKPYMYGQTCIHFKPIFVTNFLNAQERSRQQKRIHYSTSPTHVQNFIKMCLLVLE